MTTRRHRLLMIEDHRMVGQGLRRLLEPKYEVDGPYGDGNLVVGLVLDTRPDLIMLDLELENRDGSDLIPELHQKAPEIPILVVTVETRPWVMEEMILRGARGFVPKGGGEEELLAAIATVLAGRIYRSPSVKRLPWKRPVHPLDERIAQFRPPRKEIFELTGQGHSAVEIAQMLGMTVWGVHYHRRVLRRHLRITSPGGLETEARAWVIRQQTPPEAAPE